VCDVRQLVREDRVELLAVECLEQSGADHDDGGAVRTAGGEGTGSPARRHRDPRHGHIRQRGQPGDPTDQLAVAVGGDDTRVGEPASQALGTPPLHRQDRRRDASHARDGHAHRHEREARDGVDGDDEQQRADHAQLEGNPRGHAGLRPPGAARPPKVSPPPPRTRRLRPGPPSGPS
jgi:hypothetical protein